MLVLSDLQSWLAILGIEVPVVDGYWVPDEPDQVAMVFLAGGPGLIWERLGDRQAIAIRCRSLQNQPSTGAALAAQVDAAILGAFAPVQIGTQNARDVDRAGAPPRYMGTDRGFRATYQAQYLFTIARTT